MRNKHLKRKERVSAVKKMSVQEILSLTIKEMMKDRALDSITVREILHASGISRPTFYKYFSDKQQLVEYVFQKELAAPFFWDFTRDLKTRELFFLQHLREQRAFYLNALKTVGQNSFYHMWLDQACRSVEDYFESLPAYNGIPKEDLRFYAKYLSYAYVNMNIEWLENDGPETPEEMSEKIDRIMGYGMYGVLEQDKK